jgi:HSP20 family protein
MDWPLNSRRFGGMLDPFEEMFRSVVPRGATQATALPTARMDVIDKADHYEVLMEMPGIRKEDIQVHMDGNRLYIQASKQEEVREETDRVYWTERSFGSIRRTVEMPGTVDPSKIFATSENGLLKIQIGKKEAESGKMVPIQ